MNNKFFVLGIALFACVTSWTMDIKKEITKLKAQRSQIMDKAKKQSGGDSTIAYRSAIKANREELDKIDQSIEMLTTIGLLKALSELKPSENFGVVKTLQSKL